jgi:DNA-binding NtrC family response regulator
VRIRVLVVVRSETQANAIQFALEQAGFEVTLALSCAEARQCAWLGPFAVGVIDVELVDGDGRELGEWLCREAHVCASVLRTNESSTGVEAQIGPFPSPMLPSDAPSQALVMAVGQLAEEVLKRQLSEVGDILRRHSARPPRGRCADSLQRGRISLRPPRPPRSNGNEAARKS